MKATKTLSILSLMLIAVMLTVPYITAQEWGMPIEGGADDWSDSFGTPTDSSADDWSNPMGTPIGGDADDWSDSFGTTDDVADTDFVDYTDYDYFDDFDADYFDNTPNNDIPPEAIPNEADAVWTGLVDTTIYQGAVSGTTIQTDVFSKCADPDTEQLVFGIATTSPNFGLTYFGSDLKILNLNENYLGTTKITLTCNGVSGSFNLNVIERPTTNTRTTTPTTSTEDGLSIHLSTIRMPYEATTGIVPITLAFKNDGNKKLDNVKATVVIQELGVRASVGPFDLQSGKKITKTIYVDIPEETYGMHYARIMVDAESVHRVKHRELEILV